MSQSFTDSQERKWTFACNTFTLARCKRETGVDLAKEGGILEAVIGGDVAVFFDVIVSLLQDDMKAADVSPQQLGEAINDEDIMMEASRALVDSVFLHRFRDLQIGFLLRRLPQPLERRSHRLRLALGEKSKVDAMDFEALLTEIVESEAGKATEDVFVEEKSLDQIEKEHEFL